MFCCDDCIACMFCCGDCIGCCGDCNGVEKNAEAVEDGIDIGDCIEAGLNGVL